MPRLVAWAAYLLVAGLWGCSNPFLKRGQELVDAADASALPSTELRRWRVCKLLDYRVCVPFVVNQCGSCMFYVLLSTEPLGTAVPVVNCLTFMFTAVTSIVLNGEKVDSPFLLCAGVLLVLVGMYLCVNGNYDDINVVR